MQLSSEDKPSAGYITVFSKYACSRLYIFSNVRYLCIGGKLHVQDEIKPLFFHPPRPQSSEEAHPTPMG